MSNSENETPKKNPKVSEFDDLEMEDIDLDVPTFSNREKRAEKEQDLTRRRPARTYYEDDEDDEEEEEREGFFSQFSPAALAAIAVGVILLILLVVLLVKNIGKNGSDTKTTTPAETSQSAQQTTEAANTNALQKDAYPEVNRLMYLYYKALGDRDLSSLRALAEAPDLYTEEKLQKEQELIEGYKNLSCYTKPGQEEGEYIVFAYSEIKFINIDTVAPQLNAFYLTKNANGELMIANGSISTSKYELFTRAQEDAEVISLIEEVYNGLQKATESDEKLNNLILLLNGIETDPSETAGSNDGTYVVNGEVFTAVDEIVYAKEDVRVRASNSLESDVVGLLTAGQSAKRTGYSENFSEIVYDGYTAYVYKGFLTTVKPQ